MPDQAMAAGTQGSNGFFGFLQDTAAGTLKSLTSAAANQIPVWFGATAQQQTQDQLADPAFRTPANNGSFQNPNQVGLSSAVQNPATVVIPASAGLDLKSIGVPALLIAGVVVVAVLLASRS